jgi:DNA-directed RNA polymerase beta subunit
MTNHHTSDMTIRPEIIGLEALMSPFLQHISSQRASMFTSNVVQALVINGNEFPYISTGWEAKMGKYDFNETHRKNDIQIIRVIPRFRTHVGSDHIRSNPSYTVIYRDIVTGEIDYFNISKYSKHCYEGFGYINKLMNTSLVREGSLVTSSTPLCSAPNHDGKLYNLGMNANVCYISHPSVADDAFVISKSMARKAEHFAIYKIKVSLSEDDIPLNLYGTDDEYRIFPDIDELINPNGIIAAIRKMHPDTFIADTSPKALSSPEHLNDDILIAESGAGAQVLDVQVYCSNKAYSKLEQQPGPYSQLLKYQRRHYEYYESVLQVYEEQKAQRAKIGTKLNNLVVSAKNLRLYKYADDAKRNIRLVDKRDPIDFITFELTYGFYRKVGRGFKFTGRDGAKGVVSDIWDDEDMPVDEQGVRADILISPESVFNRMNPGQMYEQFYNRASYLIQQRLIRNELGTAQQAYNYIIGYLKDVRKVYGDAVEARTINNIDEFLFGIKQKGIFLIIPPFCKEVGPEKVLYISEKYNITESPVTFYVRQPNGERKAVTTEEPACIGSKNIMLLGKIPLSMMSAIGFGHVNQFGTPAKPEKKSVKAQQLFSLTPIRLGEDEQCMLTMSIGAATVNRFVSLTANSPKGVTMLTHTLLTASKPSAIKHINMSDEDLRNTNVTIGVFTHLMGTVGIDVSRDK